VRADRSPVSHADRHQDLLPPPSQSTAGSSARAPAPGQPGSPGGLSPVCASFSARRDLGVLVSPPARSARSTATDAGSPSRSTSCSHPIARASSGRTPAIRLTTMQACISEAGRRRSFNLAVPLQCRCYQGAGARRAVVEGILPRSLGTLPRSGSVHRWFPAVVTGSPIRVSKRPSSCKTWWAQVGSNHRLLACKAEWSQDCARLSGPVHAFELRKPCREMS
jgi:hypothetical protein